MDQINQTDNFNSNGKDMGYALRTQEWVKIREARARNDMLELLMTASSAISLFNP